MARQISLLVSLVKTVGGKEGGRGQSAPVDAHASSGASAQADARCLRTRKCSATPSLPHLNTSGVGGGWRRVVEVGGAADLGRLTPPALSAPHLLPPVLPALGFALDTEGCCMQGRPELGGARRHIQLWDACERLHACTHTRTHAVGTKWAMHLLYRTAWHSGLEPGSARRRALVRACLHTTAAWPHALAHTRCAPLRLSQLILLAVAPLKKHVLGSPVQKP